MISIIGGTALLAALLFLGLTLRKNTTVYKATGKGNEYEKCGRLHLKAKNPELRIDRLKDIFAMSSIRPSMSNVVNAHRSSGRIVL